MRLLSNLIRQSRNLILNKKIDYLVLLIIAIIPFWQTGLSGIFNKTDLAFPLYPGETLTRDLFVWNHGFLTGHNTFVTNGLFFLWPEDFSLSTLSSLGLPLGIVQRIWFVLVFALLGWGMYYLLSTIISSQNRGIKRLSCLTASVFYVINPYTFIKLELGTIGFLFVSSILPFTLAFAIKGFRAIKKGEKNWTKYALLTALLSTILLTENYTVTFLMFLFFSLYVICYMILEGKNKLAHIKFIFIVVAISMFLNAFWIVPAIGYFSSEAPVEMTSEFRWIPEFIGKGDDFVNTIRLQTPYLEQWVFHDELGAIFTSTWNTLVGISFFLLAMLALFFKPKNKQVILFTIISLVSVGLAAGLNPPLGGIYDWLWNHFPLWPLFRDPKKFYMIASMSLSILLGVSISEISKRLSKLEKKHSTSQPKLRVHFSLLRNSHKFFVIAVLCLIFVNQYPILSGNLDGSLEPMHVPDYYTEARSWLLQQEEDFRIMVVPTYAGLVRYTWGPKYDMHSITEYVFPKPVIEERVGGGPLANKPQLQFIRSLYTSLLENRTDHIGRILALAKIKYICLQNNLLVQDIRSSERENTVHLKLLLQGQKDLCLVKKFGDLYFYEVDEYGEKLIYVPRYNLFSTTSGAGLNEVFKTSDSFHFVSSVDPSVVYEGKWDTYAGTNWHGGYQRFSRTVDDYVELKFKGRSVTWVGEKSYNRGIAEVIIDGTTKGYVDQYAPKSEYQKNLFQENGLAYGEHTIRIRVTGEKNPLSSDHYISLDGFFIDDNPVLNWTVFLNKLTYPPHQVENVTIFYEKINPTRYTVHINADKPFTLVFSESYDSQWKAYYDDVSWFEVFFREPISDDNHFLVNGYANAWYIDPNEIDKDGDGGFTITLYFWPQSLFYLGLTTSLASFAFCMLYLIRGKVKDLYSHVRSRVYDLTNIAVEKIKSKASTGTR